MKSTTLDIGGCELSDDVSTRGSVNCTIGAVLAGSVLEAVIFTVAVV